MEFVQGQVFNINKFTDRFKKTKEEKELDKLQEQTSFDIGSVAEEKALLQSRIEYSCEPDLLKADIYRLKAAEIMQNYHIRQAKQQFNSQHGGQL